MISRPHGKQCAKNSNATTACGPTRFFPACAEADKKRPRRENGGGWGLVAQLRKISHKGFGQAPEAASSIQAR